MFWTEGNGVKDEPVLVFFHFLHLMRLNCKRMLQYHLKGILRLCVIEFIIISITRLNKKKSFDWIKIYDVKQKLIYICKVRKHKTHIFKLSVFKIKFQCSNLNFQFQISIFKNHFTPMCQKASAQLTS